MVAVMIVTNVVTQEALSSLFELHESKSASATFTHALHQNGARSFKSSLPRACAAEQNLPWPADERERVFARRRKRQKRRRVNGNDLSSRERLLNDRSSALNARDAALRRLEAL